MLKEKSLIFAPMEGVTNALYRSVVCRLYPEWDFFACDFLRIPSQGRYPKKHILKHFGKDLYESELRDKTIYQVLTAPNCYTKEVVKDINDLGFKWLDLNLGCPSKTVVKRKGGSYLLSTPEDLNRIIGEIRESFDSFFSVKIRIGFHDDKLFEKNLRIFEKHQVDAITIHGRTRDQLYKGIANWDYFSQAVKSVNIPIIGNGDIWNNQDINSCLAQTNAHSVMIARGALKTPWLARSYYQDVTLNNEQLIKEILFYYESLYETYQNHLAEDKVLSFFKSLCRYIFDDVKNGSTLKGMCLRTDSIFHFMKKIESYLSNS